MCGLRSGKAEVWKAEAALSEVQETAYRMHLSLATAELLRALRGRGHIFRWE